MRWRRFFVEVRAAAALNHLQGVVHFVRTVDIDRQTGHFVQGNDGNVVPGKQFAGFLEVETAPLIFTAFAQGFDEEIDGRTDADADVFVFGYEFDCFFGGDALEFVLCRHIFILWETVSTNSRHLNIFARPARRVQIRTSNTAACASMPSIRPR